MVEKISVLDVVRYDILSKKLVELRNSEKRQKLINEQLKKAILVS